MLPTYNKPAAYRESDSYILELAIKQLQIKCKRNVKRFIRKQRIPIALVFSATILFSIVWLLGKPIIDL